MYILSGIHDGLFYRHNSTNGKLPVREIVHITDLMLTNLLSNRCADFFHLYQHWRILLRDNSREKKRSGAGMPKSSPNCRWGKNLVEKDLSGREVWRRWWEKNGLAVRKEMVGTEDVVSNEEPQQVWTQGIKEHMAGELMECCSKWTNLLTEYFNYTKTNRGKCSTAQREKR